MKKTLIALAVAGISFNAAAVNLDGTTATEINTITFAQEKTVAGTDFGAAFEADADNGQAANAITKQLVVKTKAGFALDQDHFIRIDLDNGATFKTFGNFFTASGGSALSAAVVGAGAGTTASVAAGQGLINLDANNTASSEAGALYEISTGGVGASYVIFKSKEIATGVHELGNADELVAAFTANLAQQGAVNATYSLYTSVSDALNQSNGLLSKSGTLLNFDNALVVEAKNAAGQKQIDVASNSTKFVGNSTTSDFVDLTIVQNPDVTVVKHDLSAPVALGDVLDVAESQWVLNGAFNFADSLNNGFAIADDKQSASVKAGNIGTVAITVNGTDAISDGEYTAVFKPVTKTGYTLGEQPFGDISLGKNGSSDVVSLGLSPNSSFTQYVRVSNKSGVSGKVIINVIDDNGVSVPVSLAELGQPESVGARSSSASLKLKDIFAAAQAKATNPLSEQGMLRLKVEGETPAGTLSVQSYSVAKDGTTFSVF